MVLLSTETHAQRFPCGSAVLRAKNRAESAAPKGIKQAGIKPEGPGLPLLSAEDLASTRVQKSSDPNGEVNSKGANQERCSQWESIGGWGSLCCDCSYEWCSHGWVWGCLFDPENSRAVWGRCVFCVPSPASSSRLCMAQPTGFAVGFPRSAQQWKQTGLGLSLWKVHSCGWFGFVCFFFAVIGFFSSFKGRCLKIWA